jgi:hypothetical protein
MALDLSTLSDAEFGAMTARAWREAARCWAEYRREPVTSPIRGLLLTSAEAAEAYWADLVDEADVRLATADDRPTMRDGRLVVPTAPVTPPGLRRALAGQLSAGGPTLTEAETAAHR